jgi:hypothetical protein
VGFASLNCWQIRFFQQNHFISFLSETAGVSSHQHFDVCAKCAVSCQHDPIQCLNGCWEIQVSLAQGWHGNSSSKILSQFVCPSKKTQVINSWVFFSKCLNWSPKSSLSILYKSRCVLASIVCILWSTSIYAGACHKLCLYIRFEVKLSVVTQKSAPSLQISRFALLIKTMPRIKTPIRTSTSSDSLQHKLDVTNNRLNRPCCNMP